MAIPHKVAMVALGWVMRGHIPQSGSIYFWGAYINHRDGIIVILHRNLVSA